MFRIVIIILIYHPHKPVDLKVNIFISFEDFHIFETGASSW
jgi:hypothetical protein